MGRSQRIFGYLFLCLVVVGGGVALDALGSVRAGPESAPASDSSDDVADSARRFEKGRAFVFVIDSLRWETAMDPAIMPNLAALRSRSTFARVTPSNDAVTVPSIREAFTGEQRTKLLGFVSNFLKKRAGVRSIFTDLAAAGRKSAAFSDDAFTQFGEDAVEALSNGDDGPTEVRDQNETVGVALGRYASSRYDLIVMHITYTDHVAHEEGVGSDRYKERFHAADERVGAIDRSVPESDTAVVMGDHGHDERGRHAFGLDVPTFALYRGPRFRRALDLGTIPIRDHRYLLGWALGLPLPAEYDGKRHPEALVSSRALPADYAPVGASVNEAHDAAARAARRNAYLWTAVDLAVAFTVWAFVMGPLATGAAASPALRALAWASVVPRFVANGSLPGALSGIAASLACLAWLFMLRRRGALLGAAPPRDALRALAGASCVTVLGFGFAALGLAFPTIRPMLHEPTYQSLTLLWVFMAAAALALSFLKRDARFGGALLLSPLFLFFPTVYRYGSVAGMAPSWVGLLACIVVAATAYGASLQKAGSDTVPPLRGARATVLALAAPAVLLTPFMAVDSSDYRFGEWVLYPADANRVVWILGAVIAKAIVLVRREQAPAVRVMALVLTTMMVAFEQWRSSFPEEALSALLVGYAAWSTFRRSRTRAETQIGELAWIAGLLLAHHAFTRAEPEAYFWRDWLLAAVFLSGRLVRDVVPLERRRIGYAALLFLSLIATGWVTFAWTVHRLEWAFLYEWFRAPFVERHVGVFLPLIIGRYLLPLVVARRLLSSAFGPDEPYPGRAISGFAGLKIASLFLMTVGIGYTSQTTEIYLEGAEETAIAGVLSAGLL